MNKKLENFLYSQNSINTYKCCPLKFKFKYIDKINWKQDDEQSRDYYENLKLGTDFHLICERYFSSIPIGSESIKNDNFNIWLSKIKRLIPIKNDKKYLTEYEVRLKNDYINIQAKYDLIIIENDSINIWDWKTENRKIEYKNIENRMQTLVYLYLCKEVVSKLHNLDINPENISMNYYQPEFYNEPIKIKYSKEKHIKIERQLYEYINKIKTTNFDFDKSLKNNNHCKFCEFNKLCNNEEINFSMLEDEIYGS